MTPFSTRSRVLENSISVNYHDSQKPINIELQNTTEYQIPIALKMHHQKMAFMQKLSGFLAKTRIADMDFYLEENFKLL